MKEIKLKIVYIIFIILFILVNTHAFVWFVKTAQPLAATPYNIPDNLVEFSFKGMVVYTIITGIGNIFFISKAGRKNWVWFFVTMLADCLLLAVTVILTIFIFNARAQVLLNVQDLFNVWLLIVLYSIKESLLVYYFRKNRPEQG